MTESSIPFIRPMTLPELLDQAVRIYRQNFLKFLGIIAIPYIPLVLAQGVLAYITADSLDDAAFNPMLLLSSFGSMLFGAAQFFLIQGIATAAFTRAIADTYLGRTVDIIDSYLNLKGSWARLILALMFMGIVMIGATIWWFFIPCIGWFSGGGILVFLSMVVFPLVAPIVVLENRGVIESVRRAWDLGRSRFWWFLGYALIINLFGQFIVTGPVLIIGGVMRAILASSSIPLDQHLLWATVIQTLVSMTASMLYLPLQLTAITVAYMDLRVRFEGLDLILQTAESTGAPLDSVFHSEVASSPPISFITGKDMGFFVLLSAIGGLIYILFGGILFLILVIAMASYMP